MPSATCPATSIRYNSDRFTRLLRLILNIPTHSVLQTVSQNVFMKSFDHFSSKTKMRKFTFLTYQNFKGIPQLTRCLQNTALSFLTHRQCSRCHQRSVPATSMQSPNLPRAFLGCDHHRKVSKMNHRGGISKAAGNCYCITGGRGALSQPCLRVRGQQATWTLLSSSLRRKLPGDSSQVSYGGRSHSPLPSPSSVLSSDPWLWL